MIQARAGYYCGDCVPYVHDKDDWAADLSRPDRARPARRASRAEYETGAPEITEPERVPGPSGDAPEEDTPVPETPAEEEAPVPRTPPDEDDPIVLMQRILDELKPIRRAIMYEKTSIWNTLGVVAQIFALAVVLFFLSEWAGDSEQAGERLELLLLAIFLQLATLTFFLRGK